MTLSEIAEKYSTTFANSPQSVIRHQDTDLLYIVRAAWGYTLVDAITGECLYRQLDYERLCIAINARLRDMGL